MPSKKKLLRAAIAEIGAMIDKTNALIETSAAQHAAWSEESRRQREAYWAKEEAQREFWRSHGLELPPRPAGEKFEPDP